MFFIQQTLESALILLVIIYILNVKKKLIHQAVFVMSVLTISIAIYSSLQSGRTLAFESDTGYSTFSTNRNILIFSFDAIQGELLDHVLQSGGYAQLLDGFTRFTDVISYAPDTAFSTLTTMTGRYLPTGAEAGATYWDLAKHFKDDALPALLHHAGYETTTYNINCVITNQECLGMRGVLHRRLGGRQAISIYDIAMLRVLPEYLGWHFINYVSSFTSKDTQIESMLADKVAHGWGIDIFAFRRLYEEPIKRVENPIFKFYHYLFTHQPIRFDAACHHSQNIQQDYESAKALVHCFASELTLLVSALKKQGVFDNSLIIITSDHGFVRKVQRNAKNGASNPARFVNRDGFGSASRYRPILLVKPVDTKTGFRRSAKPVSLLDIFSTVCIAADIRCDTPVQLYDLQNPAVIPESRSRDIIIYEGGAENRRQRTSNSKLFRKITVRAGANVSAAMRDKHFDG